jgi:hypothetical protein
MPKPGRRPRAPGLVAVGAGGEQRQAGGPEGQPAAWSHDAPGRAQQQVGPVARDAPAVGLREQLGPALEARGDPPRRHEPHPWRGALRAQHDDRRARQAGDGEAPLAPVVDDAVRRDAHAGVGRQRRFEAQLAGEAAAPHQHVAHPGRRHPGLEARPRQRELDRPAPLELAARRRPQPRPHGRGPDTSLTSQMPRGGMDAMTPSPYTQGHPSARRAAARAGTMPDRVAACVARTGSP